MKRSALFAVVALLAFAACASDKDSPRSGTSSTSAKSSVSSGPSTPPTTTKNSAKAFATAKRLGCNNARLSPARDRVGLPNPIASVSCTAKGVRHRVEVYANKADRERLVSAASTKLRCGLLKALGGGTGPIYTVNGDDFSVTASGAPGANDALKQAEALGKKLGLPVTTTKCG